jgi:hypothetical protein
MKGVILFLGFGLFMASLNGCYTIVSNSNNVNGDVNQTTIINYPPPPPVISPIIIYPPSPPPPPKRPVITRPPEERPKWKPSDRDPLRGHGDRGNQKITSDRIKRDDNNSLNRR